MTRWGRSVEIRNEGAQALCLHPLRSLSGKGSAPWLCEDSECLCGEITLENIHHRVTEIAQRP
jgi:hypothetical protein